MKISRVICVDLGLGCFDPKRKDKGLTEQVAAANSASTAMLSVSKRMLPEKAAEPIRKYDTFIREFVDGYTDPWLKMKVLDLRAYPEFMGIADPAKPGQPPKSGLRQFRAHRQEVLVPAWAKAYPDNVEFARKALGDAFDPDEYPPLEVAVAKFTFELNFIPIQNTKHLVLDLAEQEMAELSQNLGEQHRKSEENARLNGFMRMAEPLCKFAKRMQFEGEAAEGFKTLFTELGDTANRLGITNVTDDPHIEELRQTIQQQIIGPYTAEQIINNKDSREAAQAKAQAILEQMKGYLV